VWIDNELEQEVQLAPNFRAFLNGLVDGNPDFVFGFSNVDDQPAALAQRIANVMGIPLMQGAPPSGPAGTASERRDYAGIDNTSRLYPNKNASSEYIYPENPECDWILACKVGREQGEALATRLAQDVPYPVTRIHTPPWQT